MPNPPEAPISDVAHVKPPPPKSLKPISTPFSRTRWNRSSLALKEHFSRRGLGSVHASICLFILFTQRFRSECDAAKATGIGWFADKNHIIAFTSHEGCSGSDDLILGLFQRDYVYQAVIIEAFVKYYAPPMFGTPKALPYCHIPSTTPSATHRTLFPSGRKDQPNSSGSAVATTVAAPMQLT